MTSPVSLSSASGETKPLNIAGTPTQGVQLTELPGGGVCSAKGFSAVGIHAGFRADPNRLDFALIVADEPSAGAGVFTQNVFCAAPVTVSREHLDGVGYGSVRAIAVNSGIANAATGQVGLETARTSANIVAQVVGCPDDEVLVASTGVIGQHLQMEPFESGVPQACKMLSRDGGASAARAIMTTDTHPKEYAVTFSGNGIGYDGRTFTVGGMCKGSGMIMPNMATMIAVLTTDAPIAASDLHNALTCAVNGSFNKVTVDSDTSTNDTCIMMASGAAAPSSDVMQPGTSSFALFEKALQAVCTHLAREMATDGEGATRLVTVNVGGAQTPSDADAAARTVANSPLVKTAIYGHDANWGRIAGAIGRSGASFKQENVSIDIMGIPVCRCGLTVPFDEDEALRRFESPEVVIDIDLGVGDEHTTIWTCDFSHEYVSINGDYRS